MATEGTSTSGALHQQWLKQVDTALRSQGQPAAAALAVQAVAAGVDHPAVLNLAGQAHFGEGRIEEAASMLRRARKLAPNDAHVLNSLAICEQALGQVDAALGAYSAALRADPSLAAAHYNRGSLLKETGEVAAAREDFVAAIALDRNYVDALSALAWLESEAGNTEVARPHAERALSLAPTAALARMALASAELQAGDLDKTAGHLSLLNRDPALSPLNRAIVLGLIADLQDAAGRHGEAFRFYQASNEALRALNAPFYEEPGVETALGRARRLGDYFEGADPKAWHEAPSVRPRAADPRAHVFLVGFPRSGTTLLENVLAAHPEVVSLEEKDCLERVADPYLATDKGLDRLAHLPPQESARQRDAYWACVRSHGVEPRGRIFIDKFPLSSVQLPVIAKLFPSARILFARRDPRDVVLSCFRRRFGINASMYQMLTLAGAAAFYDAVMRLSEIYLGILPLPYHVVRYESLVDDFEATARSVCDFLGIDWTPEMLDFAAKARARGIGTPSAAQVARGLNRDGQGVWRRYEAQLRPVLPLLEAWVRQFGYSDQPV